VVDTLPNSPAQKAGLLPGDQILAVDKTPTDGMVLSEVTDLIRGPEGKAVTILIARKGGKPFDVTITREKIDVSPVESKVLDGGIGYVRLFQFNQKTVEDTRAALMDFEKRNVKGTVIDLRNNPGGLLDECIRVASMLLPADKNLIVSTRERNQTKEQNRDPREKHIYSKPLVVLVNRGSASASEILSGALKDHGRATVIGEPTFGKALVQTVETLGDRNNPCAMAITIAHYYTPNGTDIARDPKTGKGGVDPNIVVKLDKDVRKLDEKDNQAQEAIRVLKDLIAKNR
jgi:carboxyl-terminal processing protease